MKKLLMFVFTVCILEASFAQRVGIGTTSPHASAALDVTATDKAFYPPRMRTQQRTAIANPQAGALVFDTDKAVLFMFDGQGWLPLSTGDPNSGSIQKRIASDGQTFDAFGREVAISGDYAIAGAPDKTAGSFSKVGGAYIFHRVNGLWAQEFILAPPSPAADLKYGFKVDIFNNYAIVSTGKALVYIYQRFGTSWVLVTSITASDWENAVAISADHAVVANATNITVYKNSGTFVTNWVLQSTLVPSNYSGPIDFALGARVAIWQNEFIVGASYKTVGTGTQLRHGVGQSYVFVLNNNTWTEQGKLYNPIDPTLSTGYQEYEHSGSSVDIQGDTAIVGVPGKTSVTSGDPFGGDGAFYIFKRTGTTWSFVQEFNGEYNMHDNFGGNVAISGQYFLASAPRRFRNGIKGGVYIYKYNSAGIMTLQLLVTDPSADGIGAAAALSGNSFIIGNGDAQLSTGKISFGDINNN